MPRHLLRTGKGQTIGDGLEQSLKALMVKLISASLNNTGVRRDEAAEDLLSAMDSVSELQTYARMIRRGELDQLITRMVEDGFIEQQDLLDD